LSLEKSTGVLGPVTNTTATTKGAPECRADCSRGERPTGCVQ